MKRMTPLLRSRPALAVALVASLVSAPLAQQRGGFESISSPPGSGVIDQFAKLTQEQARRNTQAKEALSSYQQEIVNVGQRGTFSNDEKNLLNHLFFSAVTNIRSALTNALGNSEGTLQQVDQLAVGNAQLAGELGARITQRLNVLTRIAQREQISEDDVFIELSPQERQALQMHQSLLKEGNLVIRNGQAHVKQLKDILHRAQHRAASLEALRTQAQATYTDLALYDRIYQQMVQDGIDEAAALDREEEHARQQEAIEAYQRVLDQTSKLAPSLGKRDQPHLNRPAMGSR